MLTIILSTNGGGSGAELLLRIMRRLGTWNLEMNKLNDRQTAIL